MKKLSKKAEPLFAFSAFGPNLLMIFVTAYLLDAVIPAGLVVNRELWSFTGAAIAAPALFSLFFFIAKIIDGLVDFPVSIWLQNLKAKYGRNKTAIMVGFIPMVVSYILLWNPPMGNGQSAGSALYIAAMALLFFCAYTLTLLAYYNTFAEITENEKSRVRLSSWKSVFDTIGYSIAYALVPMFIGFGLNIQKIVMYSLPLFLTMIIPMFLLKEGAPQELKAEQKVTLGASLKTAFSNKDFMNYIFVLMAFQFGLQMFLAAQNVIASGVMLLNGWQIAIMNTAAFAPVPIMILIFNKIQRTRGLRFGLRTALIAFAAAMLIFTSTAFIPGENMTYVRLCIGATGGLVGSFAIAVFFAILYIIPSQIGANEIGKTGRNTSSMLFAIQGLAVQVVSSIAVSLVYINLKGISVFGREEYGMVFVAPIVAIACVVAFFLARRLPKSYEKSNK